MPDIDAAAQSHPPLAPIGEVQVVEVLDYRQRCLNSIADLIQEGAVVSAVLTTLSDTWGLVFRADFKRGADTGVLNRLVCWEMPDGRLGSLIGGDEDLQPLDVVGG